MARFSPSNPSADLSSRRMACWIIDYRITRLALMAALIG
jgi:hypothetical protein